VTSVTDEVSRGQRVKVKVVKQLGNKLSLSMKDVDQHTGRDLNARSAGKMGDDDDEEFRSNPSRPATQSSMPGYLNEQLDLEDDEPKRHKKRMSSPDLWIAKQLIMSGTYQKHFLNKF
jgi:ATP-dependent RNA helicase DHX8/PRP22